MPITTCVFDAYGTLFDVNAAARVVAEERACRDLAATRKRLACQAVGIYMAARHSRTALRFLAGDPRRPRLGDGG